jgi:hypothetical protein
MEEALQGIIDKVRAGSGALLAEKAIGYLVSSKAGLTEDEMLDLLSGDAEVMDDIRKNSYHQLPEKRLPRRSGPGF